MSTDKLGQGFLHGATGNISNGILTADDNLVPPAEDEEENNEGNNDLLNVEVEDGPEVTDVVQDITPYNPLITFPTSFNPISLEDLETEDPDTMDTIIHVQLLQMIQE